MDDLAVREAALRLAIASRTMTGTVITPADVTGLLERAEQFEAYLRGPITTVQPEGSEYPLKATGWREAMGLR